MEAAELAELLIKKDFLTILTGAGISSESGLPTFRGKDGYWKKGSKNYHPMKLATFQSFSEEPEIVWEWYHYRRKQYSKALPNAGHYAIANLEKIFIDKLGKSFHLITQNVDNLHLRAGSNPKNLFEIHGNIYFMRCANHCTNKIYKIDDNESGIPKCPECGANCRPHVLWFDESYNEEYYKFNSASQLAKQTDALIIVGTTLQTTLPYYFVSNCLSRKILILNVNPDVQELPSEIIISVKEKSGIFLPKLVKEMEKVIE